jgi:hypothetical protein
LAALLLAATGAQAQAVFGTQPVGAPSGEQNVTVTAQVAGTVHSVQVLAAGVSGLDFAAGSGASTCASATLTVNQACTEPVTFTPAAPGLRIGAVVLLDSTGNVLGTSYLSGTGSGGLGVFVPGTIQTVAGSGQWVMVLDGNTAITANLELPSSVALDGAGNLYIADSVHNRIRMVCASATSATIKGAACPGAGIITTVAGTGDPTYTGDGGLAVSANLNSPSCVAIDGAGNLYIADTANNVVRMITAATGIITTVAGNGTAGSTGDTKLATLAELNQPWGVTLDISGNLYIADTANHRIREVTASNDIITTVAGDGFMNSDGTGGYSGDHGPATAAELNFPFAVAFDALGNMYIPDSANNRVRVVSPSGIITTFAGTGIGGHTGDGGPANAADLWSPSGLAVDPAGNVYIADTQNNRIRKVSSTTQYITSIAGNGYSAYGGDNGSATAASMYGPYGIALDRDGDLFIADYFNQRVREILSNLAILNFTATPVRQGSTSAPQDQTVENDGNAALDLTAITPDQNAAVNDASITNPCAIGNPFLAVDADCAIGAVFAPSPIVTPTNPETGNIDVISNTVNSPLDIQLIGDATAVNSTTITMVSSLNPSGFGQGVTFTATVTTGATTGNLTGTVSFFDGATTLAANVALRAPGTTATATYTTSALVVGLHTITASYNGDALHFSSKSTDNSTPPLIQTVLEGTATNLQSSQNPSVGGANVVFTATVTVAGGGGVAPDGTVTFTDTTTGTILGTPTLSVAGVAILATATLVQGTHAITAAYGGDANKQIEPSTSAVLNQDVQASATTVVTSTPNPSNYGVAVTFTATVTPTGTAAVTGVVNFLDGGNQIGTANLVGATDQTTFTTSSLVVGQHIITAAYLGDLNNGPSASLSITQTVNKTTPTITWATPAAITYGTALSATQLNASSGAVTGTLVYTPAAGTVLAAGSQTLSVTFTPTDTIDYNTVTATVSLTVNKVTPTLEVSTSGTPSSYGVAVTFTATVSSGPTSTVTFYDGANSIGAGTLSGATATFTTSTLTTGPHTITAFWAGNSNYNPVTSSPITQTVNMATLAITWPTPAPITYGTALSSTQLDASTTTGGSFTYSPALSTVLGAGSKTLSVIFTPTDTTDYNTATASVTLTVNQATPIISWAPPAAITYGTALSATQLNASSGTVTGTLVYTPAAGTVLAAGVQTLSVTFIPTDTTDYTSPTATVTLTVNKATPTLAVSTSGTPSNYGAAVIFTATVSNGPTGTVTFYDAGNSIGTGTLSGVTATFTTSTLTTGPHAITAFWAGNSNYISVTSSSITQTVNLTQTSTTIVAVPNPGIAGTSETITATVKITAGAATITGNVTFTDTFTGGTVTLGSANLGVAGTATINPTLAPGQHSIVATYSGDSNDNGSASTPLALTVQLATTSTVVTSTPNPTLVQTPVTFTAKVTGNGGIPTGSVSFLADGTAMGPAVNVDATGTATFTYAGLAAGSHQITAAYAGDANDSPSISAAITQVVGAIPTITGLGAATTTGTNPQVILVATVLGSVGPTPTGTVTFNNGSAVIGTAPLDSSGVATLTPNLPLGTYSIVAVYSGDALHSPSTSQPVSISNPATGFNLTVTPASVTMATTQNATVTVTLTSNNGFADTIGLGCASLPAGVTCHFSNFSVGLAANGVQTSQLTIDTNYPLTGGSAAKNTHTGNRSVNLAGLLLPFSAFFGWILWRFRRRNAAVFTMVLVLLLTGAAMLATGCSGIGSSSAAPGTYVIQVTGTGANSDIIHYQNVTLTITK